MSGGAVLVVTLDRAAGTAQLRKDRWSAVVTIEALPRWRDLYRGLRDRKEKKGGARPWARFYAGDVRALEAAILEAGQDG